MKVHGIVISGGVGGLVSDGLKITSTLPILLPNGTKTAPSLAYALNPGTGFYSDGGGGIIYTSIGVTKEYFNASGFFLASNLYLAWGDDPDIMNAGAYDVRLYRDAANTLALKNANAEQQFNIYSGNGAYGLIKSKQELVTTTAAATAATAAGFIPDGAVPLGISTYVETAITTAGLTGYNIGDGADADRWGAITGHAVGTKSNNADWTATTIQAFIAAQAITLTAVGASFPAGGKIRVCMTYILSSEPTS